MTSRRTLGIVVVALSAVVFETPTFAVTPEQIPAQESRRAQTAPEPVELALFGAALMAFAFRLRRKA